MEKEAQVTKQAKLLPTSCAECKYCERGSLSLTGWCYMQDDLVDITADNRDLGCPLERQ